MSPDQRPSANRRPPPRLEVPIRMQFVCSSLAAAREREASAAALHRGDASDADELARRQLELFGSEEALLGPARRLLDSARVVDFLQTSNARGHSIASVDVGSMLVADALKLLSARQVLSAPLFDVHRQKFLTVVDVGDFLRAFLDSLGQEHLSAAALQAAGEKFSLQSLAQVAPPEEECDGEMLSVDTAGNATLLDVAASVFLRPAKSHARVSVAHRCVCFAYTPDAELSRYGWKPSLAVNVVGLLSQSDIIRHLHAHADQLGPLRNARVCDLLLGSGPVTCVAADTAALEAFCLMFAEKVSAVGIVSPAGTLIGNLSVSDLRGLLPSQYGRLTLPVAAFVGEQHAESLILVSASAGSTFFSVLDRMVHARVHHVYVVDDAGRPELMITPTDVLRLLTPPGEHSVAESHPLSRQLAHATAAKAAAAAADAAKRRESPLPNAAEVEREAAALAEELRGIVRAGGPSEAAQ